MAVNTNSGFLMVTSQTGEVTKYMIIHCLKCFSYIKIPYIIKKDTGSGFISKKLQQFCSGWNIEHKTGIPYESQGQGVVDHANGFLKT